MTAGSIISGGFALVRDRPGAVAIWGLVYLLMIAGMGLLMVTQFGDQLTQLADPAAAAAVVGAMIGQMLLLNLLFFIVFVVLLTAAQRAVLHPERSGFAYLRLGLDEVRMVLLGIFLAILFYVGVVVASLAVVAVGAVAAVATGSGLAAVIVIPATIAVIVLALWFMVRLSLAFPLTLLRGRFVFAESWRVTRGRSWSLLGGFLAVFLIMIVISVIAGLITSGGYFAALMKHGLNPEGMRIAAQEQLTGQFGSVSVMTVVGWIVSAAAGAIGIAVYGGALATAARELTVEEQDVSERFA